MDGLKSPDDNDPKEWQKKNIKMMISNKMTRKAL